MGWYRFYACGADGHIVRRVDHELENDDAARAHAPGIMGDAAYIEIWQLTRFVARIDS